MLQEVVLVMAKLVVVLTSRADKQDNTTSALAQTNTYARARRPTARLKYKWQIHTDDVIVKADGSDVKSNKRKARVAASQSDQHTTTNKRRHARTARGHATRQCATNTRTTVGNNSSVQHVDVYAMVTCHPVRPVYYRPHNRTDAANKHKTLI